jgi:hypothetical protein
MRAASSSICHFIENTNQSQLSCTLRLAHQFRNHSMTRKSTAGKMQYNKQQYQANRVDADNIGPTWCARDRNALWVSLLG